MQKNWQYWQSFLQIIEKLTQSFSCFMAYPRYCVTVTLSHFFLNLTKNGIISIHQINLPLLSSNIISETLTQRYYDNIGCLRIERKVSLRWGKNIFVFFSVSYVCPCSATTPLHLSIKFFDIVFDIKNDNVISFLQ